MKFAQLLKYRRQILDLMVLLVDKTKSERGYTSTGRLITRALHTVAETYPTNSRFVNTDEWNDPGTSLTCPYVTTIHSLQILIGIITSRGDDYTTRRT